VYAVAMWGNPVARAFNNRGMIELRRMAICETAPKNTATRMIGWMLRDIKKSGRYVKAISYQDTEVHTGTIYKASGWKVGNISKGDTWTGRKCNNRIRNIEQSTAPKIRWEFDL